MCRSERGALKVEPLEQKQQNIRCDSGDQPGDECLLVLVPFRA